MSKDLKQAFEDFHKSNPSVYFALEKLAQQMWNRGRRHISIKMLFEVLRWDYYIQTNDPNSEFKLNNNYTAYYARFLMLNHPEWVSLFKTKKVKGE